MIDTAIVLVAGKGTRLGDLTRDIPKPMLTVGDRPLIDRIVDAIVSCGIEHLVFVTEYHADRIEAHIRQIVPDPVFVRQGTPHGTGHALQVAVAEVDRSRPVFVGWGDIATADTDFADVVDAFEEGTDVTLAVNYVEDPSAGGAVMLDSADRVTGIIEKPPPGAPPSHWNNSGLMVAGPRFWPHLDGLQPSARGELELPDAINTLIDEGGVVQAVRLTGPWFDIGTPQSLDAARRAYG